MTIGVVAPLGYGATPSQLRDLAVASDRAGLFGIQVGELASTEIFSLAGAMVAATERIRIETAVVATLTRAPTLLAMAADTLADLSGRRFVLGLGSGSPIVASWHGKQFYPKPLTAVVDTVAAVRAALSGEQLGDFGGFRLAAHAGRADVPIFVSAMGERMLRAGAQVADGVVVNFCDPARAATQVRTVRASCRPVEFVANVWACAGDDIEIAQTRLRWEVAPYLAVPAYRAAALHIADADDIDKAAAAWRSGGRAVAAPLVPEALVDALLVHGDAAAFRRRIDDYRLAGVDAVRLVPLTSHGAGVGAAHDVVDVLGELLRDMAA